MIDDPIALGAVLAAIVAVAFGIERRFSWGRQVGASLLVIALGALLSNTGLVAEQSPVYELVSGPVTSLAIAWLLFAVDLRSLKRAGPQLLATFALAVLATGVAAGACAWAFAGRFGEDSWRLAGVLTGTYSGGSLNFVAVGREVGLDPSRQPELYAAATAADNVVTALWMGLCLLAPVLLRGRGFPPRSGDADVATVAAPRLEVFDTSSLVALGLGVVWLAGRAHASVPEIPSVIWLTTMALVLAQLGPVRRLAGAMVLGTLALHFFFAVIGVYSRIDKILEVGPAVFFLTAAVVLGHGVLLFGAARLTRRDGATTVVASVAAIGGPSTAVAVAIAKGWTTLVLPGLVVGLLGYAVGTYLGLGVAWIVRALL